MGLKKYLDDYRATGELFATRPRTAETVAKRVVDPSRPQTLVDVGAGWGPVTDAIRTLMHAESRVLALELLPDRIDYLRERFHDDARCIIHEGDAQDLRAILDHHGMPEGDGFVLSLPSSHIGKDVRRRVMQQIRLSAAEGAPIVAFQFWPHVKYDMQEQFGKKNVRTRLMWSLYRRYETKKNGYRPPEQSL